MRENHETAPVAELVESISSEPPATGRGPAYTMPPGRPVDEPPPAWRFYTSHCIALDRLVEVALSPTGALDPSFRNHATTTAGNQVPSPSYTRSPNPAAGSREGSRGGEDGDSAEKRRYGGSSHGMKWAKPAAASPSSSASPSSEAPNHHRQQGADYFQQQEQQQKLKRRLSSIHEISAAPAGRGGRASLRVRVEEQPHAKRFKLTPRFKALVDISC